MSKKPVLGITMGDPAGCGPELSVKALRDPKVYEMCSPLIVGDAKMIEDSLRILNDKETKINVVHNVKDAKFEYGTIDVYDMDLIDMSKFEYGKVSAMCGDAAFKYVVKVIELAMNGEIDGTVTNALNKEAMNNAGHHYSGHTEIYADYTKTPKYSMLLASDELRVIHCTTHVSLRQACDLCKKDRVYDVIKLAHNACLQLGIKEPKVGVCGLNPHAGENGLFGREELDEIIPAIEKANAEGMNAIGPLPPDTAFSKARGGWFDIVVVMYHDQGHIPLKLLGFVYDKSTQRWGAVTGVNITLGIPVIRTSVDHGTAFDQAGKGVANELSLINAIQYAVLLAENKDVKLK